jgi:selenocysteine lyase/cysteine desulfurase
VNAPSLPPRLGDRGLFPDLEARAYLAHAAISPPSRAVVSAVHTMLDDYAHRGIAAFFDWHERRSGLRERLATLCGVRAEDLGFCANTTRGIGIVADSFRWSRGDRIVLLEGEFPANVTPWQLAARREGLEVDFIPVDAFRPDRDEGMARLKVALEGGARMVAVSLVQFQSGLRMPVEEMARLCHEHDARLFVDAIQGLGVVPFDVSTVDFMACGSHKWLMGLEGSAVLYVHPDRWAELRPWAAGWASHEDAFAFLERGPGHLRYDRPIRNTPDFIEGGAYNAAGLVALDAAVSLLLELGVDAIFAHVSAYLDALEAGLVDRGFESLREREPQARSGILGALVPAGVDVVALVEQLAEKGIVASIPDGVLRFAPHWPNPLDEVEAVLAAVDACV